MDVVLDGLALLDGGVQTCGKVCVISFLEAEDEVASVLDEVPDVGSIGTETVLGDDGLEVRVVFSEFLEPSSAGVALTVILVVTVVLEDRLGRQGDDLFAVGMDDDSRIGLHA